MLFLFLLLFFELSGGLPVLHVLSHSFPTLRSSVLHPSFAFASTFLALRCLTRMDFVLAVHEKGFGFWFRCSFHSLIARSEEHTPELQSLMRTSYADFCLKKKTK